MNRNEKLRLSAQQTHGHAFKHGVFMRLYEQSFYWFVMHVKPLKPMLERVKGGEPLVYGGLPVASFENLLAESGVVMGNATEYGFCWPYAAQKAGHAETFAAFAAWRQKTVATAHLPTFKPTTAVQRNILFEIRSFNLAGSTPMQAMSIMADWQAFLNNDSSAFVEEWVLGRGGAAATGFYVCCYPACIDEPGTLTASGIHNAGARPRVRRLRLAHSVIKRYRRFPRVVLLFVCPTGTEKKGRAVQRGQGRKAGS